MNRILLLPLTALLLAACTGTEETTPPTRLAVLTDGGATVRTVTVSGTGVGTVPVPNDVTVPVERGVTLDALPGGKRLALTLRGGVESRDVNIADARPFEATGFTPTCLTATVLNEQRDRLLTLSQCENGPQQLALYRTGGSAGGTLVWRATLPVFTPPLGLPDTPPVRLALSRENGVDIGLVARPALAGGSEVIRVAATSTGAATAQPSTPVPTPAIRDLAPAPGGLIYAATDTGVQTLTSTGVPNGVSLPAFGNDRVDRLWTAAGSGVSSNLTAAWRDPGDRSAGPLRLWDGTRTSAALVANLADLRDVTFALDGNLYALTASSLSSYDTLFGLGQNNWRPRNLLYPNDARAVTWLVP